MAPRTRYEWNNVGVTNWLKNSPEVFRAVVEATESMTEDVKDDIRNNSGSSSSKTPYGIQSSANYFANNVKGQVIRTTNRQKGIPIGMIALKADNAIAYEATHGNLERVRARYDS